MAERAAPSRRFLPGDPRVSEPYRLTPQLALRVAILGFLALALFAVLFLRLWALQILSGERYLAQANDNRVRTLRLEAPRGPIVDRHGRVLVTNTPGMRVELWPSDLPKTWPAQRAELRKLAAVTGVATKDIVADLAKHGGDPLTPVVVQRGIKQQQIYYLLEHQDEFPGVRLGESYLRKYPYQSLAAQVLGYVGQISPDDYKSLKKKGYQASDSIGQSGIERTYDTYLRGKDGTAQLTVDSRGRRKQSAVLQQRSTPGETLRLTLDMDLQRAAEKALRDGIRLAHAGSEGQYADGGAIVALDPRNGAVLAMASNPTYKPSLFSGRKNLKKLAPLLNPNVAEADNFPALNRAIQVGYPPGSTFKPVTAIAAMQAHLVSPLTPLLCSPTYTVYGQEFDNWTPLIDQWVDLRTALAMSCDTYFYRLGDDFFKLPSGRGHLLQGWANRLGLGETTGLDIGGEIPGLMPTPEWRCKQFGGPPCKGYVDRIWKPGYSIQLAIGQGDLLVTPLQMTRFYALIANGGKLVTPHLAEDVEQSGSHGQPLRVLRRFGAQPPQQVNVDPTALQYVQGGLEEATHASFGTSSGVFGNFKVDIAGKTGSAEKFVHVKGLPNAIKLNQSWWCGYGPFEAPTIVVCAMIENGGHGGSAAAPAALQVFEKYFHTTATTTEKASD
ncbi:MAG TPA: penicillin-binding protein 2 [Gaiellaceae bacterium]|nr:penicillin-binding protein 2 [Gaiellaceae bacterium]